MDHRPKVLFAGHTSLDIIPDLSTLTAGFSMFRPGVLIESRGSRFATGGAVLNTGLALHRLGTSVRLLVKLGTDPYGEILQEIINENLISNSDSESRNSELVLIEDPVEQTSFTFVLNPPNADRMFIGCPGVNRTFSVQDIREECLVGVELFHFGYPTLLEKLYADGGTALATLLHDIQKRNTVTSLDMAMPDLQGKSGNVNWVSFLTKVLPYVDLFIPNIEEIMFMLNRTRFEEIRSVGGDFIESVTADDLTTIGHTLIDMGARMVGLKLGSYGFYMKTAAAFDNQIQAERASWQESLRSRMWSNRELYVPCFSVEVAGTTGAGDCTIAGFLGSLLHELSPEMCMLHAVAVGAFSVETLDSTSGVPTWQAVEDRIGQDWHQGPTGPWVNGWKKNGGVYYSPRDGS